MLADPEAPVDIFDFPDDMSASKEKRENCSHCERPARVCLCGYIPKERISLKMKIVVLQHPDEERRGIRTGRLLQLGLHPDSCTIYRGKKFPAHFEDLSADFEAEGTYLLYPGKEAKVLREDSLPDFSVTSVVLLDGTWDQAKKIYQRNPAIQKLKQIRLDLRGKSVYTVRTQPNDACLSTLESAVHSAAILQGRSEIVEPLLRPLRALCDIQLSHGAVQHDSHQAKKSGDP